MKPTRAAPVAAFFAAFVAVAIGGGACASKAYVRFPHAAHLSEMECNQPGKPACLSCPSCHIGATKEGSEAWAKPAGSVCEKCHAKEPEKLTLAPRPTWARPAAFDISFNHDKHLSMPEVKGQCVKCHQVAVATDTKRTFPAMDTCLGCHEHQEQFVATKCAPCHDERQVRVLKPVSFLSHDAAWMRRHSTFARSDGKTCALCHAQAQCDGCHDATQTLRAELRNPDAIGREYVHRFDFLSRHGIEARSQPGQCMSCHVMKNDCDGCHTQRGVSGSLLFGRNPHPANWAGGSGSAVNLHGREARRDIMSCAACHDQGPASNCVRCHRVGAYGGSPHPPGWRNSQSTSTASCAACHGGGL